jgi:hypothetical protein
VNAVLIALIVATASLTGPLLLARANARARRNEKQEDYARQDAVAAQAAEAARLLLAENKKVAETAAVTNDKLDVIHVLVNSNMTAAMQGQLVALKAQLVLMQKLAEQKVSTEDEIGAIKAVQAQIAELEAALTDRLAATAVVAAAAAKEVE